MKWASVEREGFSVPLIGVPMTSMVEECDLCGDFRGLRDVELTLSGQWLCRRCRENKNPRHRAGGSHETQAACGAAGAA